MSYEVDGRHVDVSKEDQSSFELLLTIAKRHVDRS